MLSVMQKQTHSHDCENIHKRQKHIPKFVMFTYERAYIWVSKENPLPPTTVLIPPPASINRLLLFIYFQPYLQTGNQYISSDVTLWLLQSWV